jgi:hypothetical protein
MILVVDEQELKDLMSAGLVKTINNKLIVTIKVPEYNCSTFNNNLDFKHYDVEIAYKQQAITTSTNIEDIYNRLRKVFVTDTNAHLGMTGGRNLRTGNKNNILRRLALREKEGYNLESLIKAAEYETESRIKNSTPKQNQLNYMKGMEAWLNDTNNIDAMLENMNKSNDEFKSEKRDTIF